MEEKSYFFEKLTPVSDAKIPVYEDAINFVFNDTKVKNIAISGAYGAGKSSILESYKEKNKNLRFIHLSLAHFRTSEQENRKTNEEATSEQEDVDSSETITESKLEWKILNQLIHQIPADKIPQTNFKVKKGVGRGKLILPTIFTSLFLGSIGCLVFADKLADFISNLPNNWIKTVLYPFSTPYASILAIIFSAACSVIFIYSLVKVQKNKNLFHKISLQGNEIEIFKEQDNSYFDKYLNEVLYLFENAEADVIVFEDMDRFNSSRIFERLHEMNRLVNIQREKKASANYTPLRFMYLLRDDIFISKDRTKFFDFIIPVVPVIDSSNSYEQFIKLLEKGNLLDIFDKSFLQSLSLYIDDMRILKNIYNEFVVYFHRLEGTDLNCNRMMAMITYKNLFPRDFSDLQLRKGFVFALFAEKPNLIESTLPTLQSRRNEQVLKMERVKNEILDRQQELDDAYAAKIDRMHRNTKYYTYNRFTQEGKELKEQYDVELSQRKQAVKDRLQGNLPKLETELAEIERDISLTRSKFLKDLITRENIDSVFTVTHTNEIGKVNDFNEIKSSDYFELLKFLIRHGHIDETYPGYMTYFYEGSISENDTKFLRRITDMRGAEYGYTLKEPQKIIEAPVIREVTFEQEETLNFDLLECLLQNYNKPKYASYLKALILQIRKTENFDFLSKFYNTGKSRTRFVIEINGQWENFFSLALKDEALPSAQIRQFSVDTLYFSDEKVVEAVNDGEYLSTYISGCSDYLAIKEPNIKRLIAGFSLIDVSFAAIDYETANKDLFDAVYSNNLYELNFDNVTLMLRKQYGIESDSDISHRNYTIVQSQSESPLAAYISENINTYTEIILNNCGDNIADDENIAISLLNNDNVSSDAKGQYIHLLSTVVSDILQITDSTLWTAILSKDLISYTAKNIIAYFENEGEINDCLISYINRGTAPLDFSSLEDNQRGSLFAAVIITEKINNGKYVEILKGLNRVYNKSFVENIPDEYGALG